jgi:CBS-domain-containing membrane protein
MTLGIKYILDDESVDLAADSMSLFQIRRLPVVNHDKKLVGIVSLGDLALRHNASAAGLALKEILRPSPNMRPFQAEEVFYGK